MVKKKSAKKKKSFLKGKVVVKRILKKGKHTLSIKEQEAAPYIPIYIKEDIKEDRRQFYFK